MKKDLLNQILCFLVTSARGCLDEPQIYGPLRLLEAYSMIVNIAEEEEVDRFYREELANIEGSIIQLMSDEQAFCENLNKTVVRIAKHVVAGADSQDKDLNTIK